MAHNVDGMQPGGGGGHRPNTTSDIYAVIAEQRGTVRGRTDPACMLTAGHDGGR